MSVTGVLEPSVAFEELRSYVKPVDTSPTCLGIVLVLRGVLEKKVHVKLAFPTPVVF